MVNAYFLDTSALVKRYIAETGSNWIRSISDVATGNQIALGQITWVEVLSALARRQREGSLSASDLNLVVQDLREDFENQYEVIEIDQALIETPGELVIQYPLRAYDAVQLASALRFQYAQLVFISADHRLLNMAQSEGLVTDNPNNYA